jgi:hypothetical protein
MSYLGCVLAAALCCSAGLAGARTIEVAPGPDFIGMDYSMSTGGNVFVVAGVRKIGGKVAICGLVYYADRATATTRSVEGPLTDKTRFSLAGKVLRVNARLFKRYKNKDEATGSPAGCSVTTTVWQDKFAKAPFSMDLKGTTFRY